MNPQVLPTQSTESSRPLISAEHVSVIHGDQTILQDTSLAIRPQELVTLIGPNGAGKSTFIRVLLGLLKPSSGTVQQQEGLIIGYMPQRLVIDPSLPLNVERFLLLAGKHSLKKSSDNLDRCLDLTGVKHLRRHSVQSLSGGELQRVLLARALFRDPQLLVLDEPVQGVDVSGQSALYKLIGDIRDETQCGILMVSHDLHLVMAETDRVICLNQHICCEGHPDTVSVHPEFLQLFGETKNSHVAVYTHHHDHDHDIDHNHSSHEQEHTSHQHDNDHTDSKDKDDKNKNEAQ